MKKEHRKTKHHVTPSSRSEFGREVILPEKFHTAWHILFGNLYDREVVLFIQEVNKLMDEADEITNKNLANIREEIKGMDLYEFQKTKEDSAGKKRRRK